MSEFVQTRARCPKCRSRTLILSEITEGVVQWEVIDSRFDLDDGIKDFGETKGVFALCDKCGHGWKMRDAISIESVITRPENAAPSPGQEES